MLVGKVVRRFVGLGAFFGIAAISAGACSDDEESQSGSPTSGMGGEAGQSNETGGGGAGGTQSGAGKGGASGRGGGPQGGGTGGSSSGAGGQAPVACASIAADVSNSQPCDMPGESCQMGNQCCCGECWPELICRCSEGRWNCEILDYCLDAMCGGAGGLGGGGAGGAEM